MKSESILQDDLRAAEARYNDLITEARRVIEEGQQYLQECSQRAQQLGLEATRLEGRIGTLKDILQAD